MSLDVFTFIAGNGADYAEYLKYTGEKFLSGKRKVNWKCVESLDVSRLPEGFECVGKTGGRDEHNATKHALAIHEALKNVNNEYVLLTDSDVAIVYDGWDDVIVNELNEFDCFGGAYAKTKSKFSKTRYKKFPKANFFAFRSSVLDKVQLDFFPFREGEFWGKLGNEKQRKYLGMKEGQRFAFDIGWRLPIIFKSNGLTSNYMPCHFQDSKRAKLPYLNDEHRKFCQKVSGGVTMEEWHYNGKLFATHKKHCRYGEGLKGRRGLAWKTRVDLYINRGEWYEKEKTNALRKKPICEPDKGDCYWDEGSGI